MSDEYEFGEEPNWRGHEPSTSEHDSSLNVVSLLAKSEVRITRLDLVVPFSHDPSKSYKAGTIYEESPGTWKIENFSGKFNSSSEAMWFLAETIDMQRTQMLNDEFQKEIG